MIKLKLLLHDGTVREGTYPGSTARMMLDKAFATAELKDFSAIYVGEIGKR